VLAREVPANFHDEVLGTMPWDEDEGGWVAKPSGVPFRIVLAGTQAPDANLRERARTISADPTTVLDPVAALLRTFADRVPEVASEVRALQIDAVYLLWPARPNDGMIYFSGPDPYRVWRCDYIAGVPQDLGFDD
jgi:hypothetical protein